MTSLVRRVYSIKAGCDNNPESVVRIDNTYYFAHKSSGKIFRFVEGQGIEEISDVMMSSYIRSKFKEAISLSGLGSKSDVRIVGGYDPVKENTLSQSCGLSLSTQALVTMRLLFTGALILKPSITILMRL